MILIANGTLLALQNMTWGGKLGFQKRPDQPFYVPHNNFTTLSTLAAGGVFGSLASERGLTYVAVDLAGHMVPQYAPSAAYRHVEYMLGRVNCMNCYIPFEIIHLLSEKGLDIENCSKTKTCVNRTDGIVSHCGGGQLSVVECHETR
ncbi:hypothetical protein VTI74DRAFT_1861 [Chaetomium olivicolor]